MIKIFVFLEEPGGLVDEHQTPDHKVLDMNPTEAWVMYLSKTL